MTELRINTEMLNGVLLARATEATQENLRGVYIYDEENMRHYLATNGHILFFAWEKLNEDEPRLDKMLFLALDKKIKAGKNERAILRLFNAGLGEIETSRDKIAIYSPDVEPPSNWRDVIPKKDAPALTVYTPFSPEYLGRIEKFIGDYIFERPQALVNDGLSPVVWYTPDRLAVIMPRRLR